MATAKKKTPAKKRRHTAAGTKPLTKAQKLKARKALTALKNVLK